MKIQIGDSVGHIKHGIGRVEKEWGAWKACRACYGTPEECGCSDPLWLDVSGRGIFDVRFSHGLEAINERWLVRA